MPLMTTGHVINSSGIYLTTVPPPAKWAHYLHVSCSVLLFLSSISSSLSSIKITLKITASLCEDLDIVRLLLF